MSEDGSKPMFGEPEVERGRMTPVVWLASAFAVLVVLAGVIFVGLRHAEPAVTGPLPSDPYAANLAIANVEGSKATSLAGGESTYVDGTIRNNGQKTVTAVTVQVFFASNAQAPPQMETAPLMLIRAREPYVDTQPVSASPLKPGEEREFRVAFEGISDAWNQQVPEIRVVRVTVK